MSQCRGACWRLRVREARPMAADEARAIVLRCNSEAWWYVSYERSGAVLKDQWRNV